jgi:SAM-dependent methyltransferase
VLDASPTLLAAARERDSAAEYVLAPAEALPLPDASFDLVVVYDVLIDRHAGRGCRADVDDDSPSSSRAPISTPAASSSRSSAAG